MLSWLVVINFRVQDVVQRLHSPSKVTLIYVDFYLLPLRGCDAVLGAQWLQTLGPILWDFQQMWMQFTYDNQPRTIVGSSSTSVTYSTFNSLTKLGKVVEPSYIIYSLTACGPHKTTPEGTTMWSSINHVVFHLLVHMNITYISSRMHNQSMFDPTVILAFRSKKLRG